MGVARPGWRWQDPCGAWLVWLWTVVCCSCVCAWAVRGRVVVYLEKDASVELEFDSSLEVESAVGNSGF